MHSMKELQTFFLLASASAFSSCNVPSRTSFSLHATTVKDITVAITDKKSKTWTIDAAHNLKKYGVCTLTSEKETNLISHSSCDAVNQAMTNHLESLHFKIENRGIDPTGMQDGPYRFREVVCRDGCPRFDVPIPWSGSDDDDENTKEIYDIRDFVEDPNGVKVVQEFHQELDEIVQPVVDALWQVDGNEDVNEKDQIDCDDQASGGRATSAGFLMNQKGSTSQKFHRDGPDAGYINAFVPFVNLSPSLGPTCILPKTHMEQDVKYDECDAITPLLEKGQILLFDYRTLHKGLGNSHEDGMSRTLAYVVYTKGSITDVHNFPDALTLEYD
ncbi:hypothetical protein CTEN210_18381 [Chaetoceros tenuissimus]|uniref:Phytanoyl-CoA dioxygenase n=1 Tax=Chaetoceros tenuissimus TaxID=426638 RepID=A0AAD3DEH4_9STRA|nr:hypothetical protein CTEN210_18381 [Chaetoceros tenuissimus]